MQVPAAASCISLSTVDALKLKSAALPMPLVVEPLEILRLLTEPVDSLNLPLIALSSIPYKSSSESKVAGERAVGLDDTLACGPATNIDSSNNGESTFLKKLKMLALGLPATFAAGVFFKVDLLEDGMFDFEFGRGVRGLAGVWLAIVGGRLDGLWVLGGVGALPVDGLTGVSMDDGLSRGFRNIAGAVYRHEDMGWFFVTMRTAAAAQS